MDLESFRKILPKPDQVSSDPTVLSSYGQDLWPRTLLERRATQTLPNRGVDLVVWPETTQQVAELVSFVRDTSERIELLPYGAGSGICGATIPTGEARAYKVMIDMKRLRALRRLDAISQTVTVEVGWIGENLERELNRQGFTLGHFPSSIYCSSVGGYLAARSAGQLSTKYGKMEDLVLSLEVVLPTGEVIETGRAPRSAMGPDWTQLLLGSEGSLCIFTAATLQIQPIAKHRIFRGFAARDMDLAFRWTREVMQAGLRPAALRVYDPLETQLTQSSEMLKEVDFLGGALIIAVWEGQCEKVMAAEVEEAESLAQQTGVQALGSKPAEHWWSHRYAVSYKQSLILSHDNTVLDTFEIAATWDCLPEVYRAVKNSHPGLVLVLAHMSHFYHTGANIYFSLVGHAGLGTSVEAYDRMWEAILEAALKTGATLSHHHGVGAQKSKWIRRERPAHQALFGRIKRVLDPKNSFNPGKMGLEEADSSTAP